MEETKGNLVREILQHPARLFMLLLLPLAGWVLVDPPTMLSAQQGQVLAIVILTLGLLVTSVLPGYMTALLFFLAAILLEVGTPAEIFSGFYSAAFWLIVAGMVIGMAIKSTGLGDRVAALLGKHLEHSYAWLIGGLMLTCTLLGFLMPSSMGRAVMMIPIGIALAERCGFASGSKGRTGIALAVAFGCHMPTFAILPANIPNVVLIGAAETIYDLHFSYTHYLLLHFPVLGALKAVLIAWLIMRLFPDQPKVNSSTVTGDQCDPDQLRGQKKLGIVLLITLGFWITDSLHGISPAWIGLAATCFLLLPRVGLVDSQRFSAGMDMTLLLFIAGVLGLGRLVASSGLGSVLAMQMEQWLPLEQGADFINFVSLSLMSVVAALGVTLPGVPAVLTPMAADLAAQTGWSVESVLMTQVLGFSTILFPYQSGPLLVSMQLAKEPLGHLLRVTIPLTLITLLVLMPLDYLWWLVVGELS
ncbi:citrate transporter [Marinobacterium zhoushanense]|uniref:Citrate transporter n=1 Tax=Marinobacterium zhoushanense TaxID=1679163 RepID=A0ABQ1JVV9_9GAMM|nr:SLC13 family permease [Marinobacterium zhoushanense]GGB79800.1 citrate transporter [Marinobacterium zhoushanense]